MSRSHVLALAAVLALVLAFPAGVAAQPSTSLTVAATYGTNCTVTADVTIANLVGGHDTLEVILEDANSGTLASGTMLLPHGATSATEQVILPPSTSAVLVDANIYRGSQIIASNYTSVDPTIFTCP